jgi:F-type H+-transporting ATPase subunit alpha
VSVPAQIAVLLALTAQLFDPVPIDQMADAECAVRESAANIPAEVCARFETAATLSNDDRQAMIEIARLALGRFQPTPEAKAEPRHGSESEPEAQTEVKPEPQATLKEKS